VVLRREGGGVRFAIDREVTLLVSASQGCQDLTGFSYVLFHIYLLWFNVPKALSPCFCASLVAVRDRRRVAEGGRERQLLHRELDVVGCQDVPFGVMHKLTGLLVVREEIRIKKWLT
jgi:hypothetical protein